MRCDGRLRTGLLVLAGVVSWNAGSALAQDSTIKIAVVDLERIIGQSESGRQMQAKLEDFRRQIQSEAEAKNERAREIRQRMIDGANTLAEEKMAELQKEWEDATIDIRRFRDDKEREGQKMQGELLREIERQLEPVFDEIRQQGGYDLILNRVPGVVVMANDKVDITAQVIERFNASTKAAEPAASSGD